MDNSKEIWKDIQGYEGLYQVSNFGRVRSLGRPVYNAIKRGNIWRKGKILKPIQTQSTGYYCVSLVKNRHLKRMSIHRLVANAFIPNPQSLPQVNHKDENKANNRADNLEWCTSKYNNAYNNLNKRIALKQVNGRRSKKVVQCSPNGERIRIWPSLHECARAGLDRADISRCCHGKTKLYRGYIWKFKNE